MNHPEATLPAAPAWTRPAVMLPIFGVLSVLGGFLHAFSLEANLYVVALGAVMIWLGFSRRLPRRPAPTHLPRDVVWWLVPVGVFVVIELSAFSTGSTESYPTLSVLTDPLLSHYLPRALFYFGWLAGFWGLVRR